jgi:hypothetical protein
MTITEYGPASLNAAIAIMSDCRNAHRNSCFDDSSTDDFFSIMDRMASAEAAVEAMQGYLWRIR